MVDELWPEETPEAPVAPPAKPPAPVILATKVTPKSKKDPSWMRTARGLIGTREIPGPKHNNVIVRMWEVIQRPYRNDETPWCAAFVGFCFEVNGIRSTRSEAARSYQNWGMKLDKPVPGCVVVFWRNSPKSFAGHVGFLDSVSRLGNPIVIGGNQGNAVSRAAFPKSRVVGYRWPKGIPLPAESVKVSDESVAMSTSEA